MADEENKEGKKKELRKRKKKAWSYGSDTISTMQWKCKNREIKERK
jgi:hypothetical protein